MLQCLPVATALSYFVLHRGQSRFFFLALVCRCHLGRNLASTYFPFPVAAAAGRFFASAFPLLPFASAFRAMVRQRQRGWLHELRCGEGQWGHREMEGQRRPGWLPALSFGEERPKWLGP